MNYSLSEIYNNSYGEISKIAASYNYDLMSDSLMDKLAISILLFNDNRIVAADAHYLLTQPNFNLMYVMSLGELRYRAQSAGLYLPPNAGVIDHIKAIIDNRNNDARKKIAVIGGGPVGLLFAIMIRTDSFLNDAFDVTVYEKRGEYTRKQVLLINKETYNLLPEEVKENLWSKPGHPGCYVLPPPKDNLSRCYADELPLATAPINLIESELYNYASQIGILIFRDLEIEILEDGVYVNGYRPNYDVLVGADGAESQVRSIILKSRTLANFRQMYAATVIDNVGSGIGGIFNKPTKYRIESVQKSVSQNTHRAFRTTFGQLYIGVMLTLEEYEQVRSAKRNKTSMPNWFINKVKHVCDMIKTVKCITPNHQNTSVFPVNPSYSEKYSRLNPVPTYLIGDALVSTNFFTGSGVNVGIQTANNLVQLLAEYPDGMIPDNEYWELQTEQVEYTIDKVISVGQDLDEPGILIHY